MKVISTKPAKSVKKRKICEGCGSTIEYVPNDVITLWSGTDYGGGPDGATGFKCPTCNKNVIITRW
jgi:predicted RNA-binding Zn-ribbon protein involved in translation (DUF1610 family)